MLLITGSTGYIGQYLVKQLIVQGVKPRCLVRDPKKAEHLFGVGTVELVQGDTTLPETLEAALTGVETVIHAAFMTADRKQSTGNHYAITNVDGTTNLVRAAQAAGVKYFLEISGLGTKPDKPGSYMQGRYLAEQVVKDSGLAWTIIQPSILFGPDAPFLKGLTGLIKTSPVVPLIGGGSLKFQPISVDDVVRVILQVLKAPETYCYKTYTIGGPEYLTFTEIIDLLLRSQHKKRLKLPAPLPLVAIGAAGMELVLPKPPLTKAAMALFAFDNITDLGGMERDFGFVPSSLKTFLLP
jgi:NADH dehydrogenase